jgi:hypothetical protein
VIGGGLEATKPMGFGKRNMLELAKAISIHGNQFKPTNFC